MALLSPIHIELIDNCNRGSRLSYATSLNLKPVCLGSGRRMFAGKEKRITTLFYKSFNCHKCHKHMAVVMAENLCLSCLKERNKTREERYKLPERPNVLQTHLAKVARKLMKLDIPGDFMGLQILPFKGYHGPVAYRQLLHNTVEDWAPNVKKYLNNLAIIIVEPIMSYSAQSMYIFKMKMVDAGAVIHIYNSNNIYPAEKKVMLVDMVKNRKNSFKQMRQTFESTGIPIINVVDFFHSIKTGICTPYSRLPERRLTLQNEKIMWMEGLKMERPYKFHGLQ